MAQQKRKQIIISPHAKQRLEERMPTLNKRDYDNYVNSAFYKGLTEYQVMNTYPEIYAWYRKHYLKNKKQSNNEEYKMHKNYVFVFQNRKNKPRVLKTVMDIPASQLAKMGV